jgi:hypothetical protein
VLLVVIVYPLHLQQRLQQIRKRVGESESAAIEKVRVATDLPEEIAVVLQKR